MSFNESSCRDRTFDPQCFEFLSLPDDALLAVLAYLPLRELFSCRVVCRRLRDLCLHPDLWRNAEVGGRGGLAVACYALAPCLRRLGSYQDPVENPQKFLEAGGTCVVARLGLCVDSPDDAPHASAFIEKISAPGDLRSLNLVLGCSLDETSALRLSEAVLEVKGIHELCICVRDFDEDLLLPDPGCPVQASLTRLEYETHAADPFLWSLLEAHAATLEEVRLCIGKHWGVPVTSLAKIPGLRALSCSPHNDLCELLVLPKLDTITLAPYNFFTASALDFLRRARHLRHVSMDVFGHPNSVSALFALAESCSARAVESLTLYRQPSGEVLAAILPRLPSLKDLTIEFCYSDEFAFAIRPTSAPSLTKVSVEICRPKPAEFVCWHSWLHGGALPGLLLRNPRLHLQLKWRPFYTGQVESCNCPVSRQGCHPQLLVTNKIYLFSSHGEEAGCPLGCVQLVVSNPSPPP